MHKKIFKSLSIIFTVYWACLCVFTGFSVFFNHFWLILGIISFGVSKLECTILKRISVAFTCIFVVLSLIIIVPIASASHGQTTSNTEYIIVLGAGVNKDNQPCRLLKERLDAAYECFNINKEAILILSGSKGADENISEALCMKQYLENKGVNRDNIILEEKAQNTRENMVYSTNFIDNKNAPITIATSDFHVYRATMIAKELGYTNIYAVAGKTFFALKPNYYYRECFAIIKEQIIN